jgi:signal transduction histidine kinase
MFRIYECITQQHDPRMVGLAVVICLFACYTAFSLVARAQLVERRSRPLWCGAAAVVAGGGIWATHFVAVLALRTGMPMGYDFGLTVLSVVVAIGLSALGIRIGLRDDAAVFGGAIVGAGIGSMHYTGMAALHLPAVAHWDGRYVAASIAVGIALSAVAAWVSRRMPTVRGRLLAASILAFAICAMHFTAMAALSLVPDPRITVSNAVMSPQWLAVSIAEMTLLIVMLGLVGALFDEHLASRAAREARRLHRHVAKLEATKRELEATTEQLRDALDAAAAGSQAKSQFLATMSHELRTPLNAVIGFAEILTMQVFGPLGNPRYHDYVRDIHRSGTHLLDLINDVLDIARLDVGHLELQEETVDLGDAVAECTTMVSTQAETASIGLETDLRAPLPTVYADKRRLQQVLINLLSNAIKFTPAGGTVRISAAKGESGVIISIADTGIGIAPADIPKALERFGQVDSRISRTYEGAGLGLPLAKQLIELHGGTLTIDSAVGQGTTVTVTLPAARIRAGAQAAA